MNEERGIRQDGPTNGLGLSQGFFPERVLDPRERINPDRQLIISANRAPIAGIPIRDADGHITNWLFERGNGGLTTALAEEEEWVAWLGMTDYTGVTTALENFHNTALDDVDREGYAESTRTNRSSRRFRITEFRMSPEEFNIFYNKVCEWLWEDQHREEHAYTPTDTDWVVYDEMNRRSAAKVVEVARKYNTDSDGHLIADGPGHYQRPVLINDYHKMREAIHVKELMPELKTVQFWHIPWQEHSFSDLPIERRKWLMEGMLANDFLGFHIGGYVDNFVHDVQDLFPEANVQYVGGKQRYIDFHGRRIVVGAYPISINSRAFRENGQKPEVIARAEEIRDEHKDLVIMFEGGRLGKGKGTLEAMIGLERAFEKYTDLIGNLIVIQQSHDSRLTIPKQARLKQELIDRAEAINNRFGTIRRGRKWKPIIHITETLDQETELLARYKSAHIMRITPRYDGMNLMIKEGFVVSEDDTVFMLSINAGAYDELGEMVVPVDPFDPEAFADAIWEAYQLAVDPNRKAEAIEMNVLGKQQVMDHDIDVWKARLMNDVERELYMSNGLN